MNTKRTLVTLISASLLTMATLPAALAGETNHAADGAAVHTSSEIAQSPDRQLAQVDPATESKSAMKKAADSATEAVTDVWIQGKLEAAFIADDNLSSFAINTQVKDGVATLTGTVDSAPDIERATDVTKSIKGVTAVKNLLMVKPAGK